MYMSLSKCAYIQGLWAGQGLHKVEIHRLGLERY